ncbi:Acetylcholine receptor subunit alpha-like [Habropoda laboriosa]|uniref:Acetylcholine receptor subunit alpha-like n=2 Tax=Apinae TaxID=70987 RepID=A0A0L7QP77_9HYME|nr:Acetylcholine receptor subunit alpha-like [Habropoda laboriosa]
MPPIIGETLRVWFLSALVVHGAVAGNPDAKRLYDDLLSNYNKLVRPVVNTSDVLRVCIKLKLSQLIDVVSKTLCYSFVYKRYLCKQTHDAKFRQLVFMHFFDKERSFLFSCVLRFIMAWGNEGP